VIRLEINAAGIARVMLEPQSRIEWDFDDAAYRLIQPLISRIDTRLRNAAQKALGETRSRRRAAGERRSQTAPRLSTHS
jgi:hypothetical protein